MPQPDKLNPIKLSKAQPPITFDGVLGWTRTLFTGHEYAAEGKD
jgi:hypothetical protein